MLNLSSTLFRKKETLRTIFLTLNKQIGKKNITLIVKILCQHEFSCLTVKKLSDKLSSIELVFSKEKSNLF